MLTPFAMRGAPSPGLGGKRRRSSGWCASSVGASPTRHFTFTNIARPWYASSSRRTLPSPLLGNSTFIAPPGRVESTSIVAVRYRPEGRGRSLTFEIRVSNRRYESVRVPAFFDTTFDRTPRVKCGSTDEKCQRQRDATDEIFTSKKSIEVERSSEGKCPYIQYFLFPWVCHPRIGLFPAKQRYLEGLEPTLFH